MELESLKELYVDQLRTLYDAEHQFRDTLPRMIEAATSRELRDTLEHLQEQTPVRIERLDSIFEKLGQSAAGQTSKGMHALVEETEEVVRSSGDPSVRDAGLICAAQRNIHYQIAVYGCARTFADLLA